MAAAQDARHAPFRTANRPARNTTEAVNLKKTRVRAAKDGTLDFVQLHAGWAGKLARALGVPLAPVALSVWHANNDHASTDPRGLNDHSPAPSQLDITRAAQKAVALAQQEKSAWTRADLIEYLGRVLPRSGRDRPRPPRCRRRARR